MESERFEILSKGMIYMGSDKHLLYVAIDDGFNDLASMEAGSDKYKTTVDALNGLLDREVNIEKLKIEEKAKEAELKEKELREKQLKYDQIDRYVKHGLTAISVIGGLALTVWGAKASWRFEETGTVTSTAGRKFINNLFFKK